MSNPTWGVRCEVCDWHGPVSHVVNRDPLVCPECLSEEVWEVNFPLGYLPVLDCEDL